MRFLKLPATLRWSLVNFLIIWIMMSVYRVILVSLVTDGVASQILSLIKGIWADFGAVSLVGLPFILLSQIRAFHPYKSRIGRYFGLLYFVVISLLFSLVYGLDLVFIKVLSTRISGETFGAISDNPALGKAFRRNIPYFALFTAVTLLVWVWWLIIEWLYKRLGIIGRADEKVVRLFWQSLFILLFFIGAINNVETTRNLGDSAINTDGNIKGAFAFNPVLTLLFK